MPAPTHISNRPADCRITNISSCDIKNIFYFALFSSSWKHFTSFSNLRYQTKTERKRQLWNAVHKSKGMPHFRAGARSLKNERHLPTNKNCMSSLKHAYACASPYAWACVCACVCASSCACADVLMTGGCGPWPGMAAPTPLEKKLTHHKSCRSILKRSLCHKNSSHKRRQNRKNF